MPKHLASTRTVAGAAISRCQSPNQLRLTFQVANRTSTQHQTTVTSLRLKLLRLNCSGKLDHNLCLKLLRLSRLNILKCSSQSPSRLPQSRPSRLPITWQWIWMQRGSIRLKCQPRSPSSTLWLVACTGPNNQHQLTTPGQKTSLLQKSRAQTSWQQASSQSWVSVPKLSTQSELLYVCLIIAQRTISVLKLIDLTFNCIFIIFINRFNNGRKRKSERPQDPAKQVLVANLSQRHPWAHDACVLPSQSRQFSK